MTTPTRDATFTWSDPIAVAMACAQRSGIDAMRAIASGEIPPPPIATVLGMRIPMVEDGEIVFAMPASEMLCNPSATIHGGIIATLLDTVMTCAVYTKLALGRTCTTVDINVHFVRPILPNGRDIVARGRVLYSGRTHATAEASATDDDGKLYAHATGGMAIMDIAEATRFLKAP